MEPEYALSNQELFFIVAQTVWDVFLMFLLSVAISFTVAFIYVAYLKVTNQHNPSPRSK